MAGAGALRGRATDGTGGERRAVWIKVGKRDEFELVGREGKGVEMGMRGWEWKKGRRGCSGYQVWVTWALGFFEVDANGLVWYVLVCLDWSIGKVC